jgi:hypothetical protein
VGPQARVRALGAWNPCSTQPKCPTLGLTRYAHESRWMFETLLVLVILCWTLLSRYIYTINFYSSIKSQDNVPEWLMGMTRTPLDIICLRARRFESCRCRDSFALLFVFFGWLVVEICRTEGGGWGSRAPPPQSPTNATPTLFYRAKHRVRLVHS